MALRNEETSDLGKRLYLLMDEKGLDSPKGLAKKLYELGLVHVKTRDNYNNPERDRDNAILSIEKKIVRHIKSGAISDQNGNYILAYSKFFGCSSDYILGLTDIRTPDIETRRICELLGLSETVVIKLMEYHEDAESPIPGFWSLLMDSSLLHSLPSDMISILNAVKIHENNTSDPHRDQRCYFFCSHGTGRLCYAARRVVPLLPEPVFLDFSFLVAGALCIV